MTAVAAPRSAPSPAAANTHEVSPSRGPQPPTLGRTIASNASSASGSSREIDAVTPAARAAMRKVTAWPTTTTAEASTTAGNALRPQYSVADVRHHCGPHPRPPGTFACHSLSADEDDPNGNPDRCTRNERHRRPHRGRQNQQHGDRQHGLYRLAGSALPYHVPHIASDVAHIATVTDAAVDVSGDAAGKCEVEEKRPVIRSHGGGQGQAHAEAPGDDRPPPRRAECRDEHDGRGRQNGTAVDRLETSEERAGAETPDHDRQHRHRDRRAGPATDARTGCRRRNPAATRALRTCGAVVVTRLSHDGAVSRYAGSLAADSRYATAVLMRPWRGRTEASVSTVVL